jgi:hypothetical protein
MIGGVGMDIAALSAMPQLRTPPFSMDRARRPAQANCVLLRRNQPLLLENVPEHLKHRNRCYAVFGALFKQLRDEDIKLLTQVLTWGWGIERVPILKATRDAEFSSLLDGTITS